MNGENPPPAGNGCIAILGAGSLGQLWAGYLPVGNVVFIPRHGSPTGKHAEALTYRLQQSDGAISTVSVPWLSAGSAPPSLLLATTKAGDTLAALEDQIPNLPPETPIVLFQNGMGSQQAVARRWPHRPILAASTTEGANRPEPGQTVHAGRGQTWVGALTDSGGQHLQSVVEALGSSGLTVQGERDIQQKLWDKLVINAGINAFTAILDCPNGDILSSRLYLEHIDGLCDEIAAVLRAEGRNAPEPAILRQRIEAVARSTAGNTSSMRGDVQRGRTTEIDVINGYICERGQAFGIPVPVNRMLTDRVKRLVS